MMRRRRGTMPQEYTIMRERIVACLIALAAIVAFQEDAHAYIGPGVGVTAIGTLFAVIGAIVFAILGFVWYPIKRLARALTSRRAAAHEPHGESQKV